MTLQNFQTGKARLLKGLLIAATAVSMAAASITSAQAALVDLGFLLDESGSIGKNDYKSAKMALANALDVLVTDTANQYRVGVVSFSGGAGTLVSPTILTAGNIGSVKDLINADVYTGGTTNLHYAFDQLIADFAAEGALGAKSLINITTDGNPTDQSAATSAAAEALAAGWDSISAEAVGSEIDADYLLENIVSPNGVIVNSGEPIPNPLTDAFVIKVADFDEYESVIAAKVQRITTSVVPVPAALPLMLSGLGALGLFGMRKRRKSQGSAMLAASRA